MKLLGFVLAVDTRRQALLMLLVVVSVLLGFAGIALEGRIIDDAIQQGLQSGSTDLLFRYAALYLGVFLLTHALDYQVEILFASTTQRILSKLRGDLFRHVLRLGPGFFQRNSVGEIMSRIIPEVQQLGGFLSKVVLVPLSCAVTLLAGFGLVSSLDWRLGLASGGLFALVFFFLPGLRRRLEILARRSPRLLRDLSRRTEETLSHVSEIHVHHTYAYEEKRFEKGLEEFAENQVQMARVFGATSFLNRSLSQMATLAVYTLGGWLVVREAGVAGGLTVGGIFVVVRILGQVMSPLTTLIDYFQRYREAEARFEMLTDYLRVPAEMVDPPGAAALELQGGGLEMTGVRFGFDPEQPIVRDLSLEVGPGQHVALVGPAGCGKSTVNLLLTRLVQPDAGEVRLDGRNLREVRLEDLRARVGYLGQSRSTTPALFSGTLLDNLLYGLLRLPAPTEDGAGWLDLSGAGYPSLEELYNHLVGLLRDVSLYDDVLGFGFTGVSLAEALQVRTPFHLQDAEEVRRELLRGRRRFLQKLQGANRDLVEFFDPQRFSDTSSLLENLLFSSPTPFLREPGRFRELEAPLEAFLRERDLLGPILAVGIRMAGHLASLSAGTGWAREALASRLGVSPEAIPENLADLGELERYPLPGGGPRNRQDRAALLRLGLEHTPSRAPEPLVEEALKTRLVAARRDVAAHLPDPVRRSLAPYDPHLYVDSCTVRENLIMGRVHPMLHRAEDKVNRILREVIQEIDLEDEILRLGLCMDVGERGGRLSGGQSQKASLVRVLLKRPEILILDEATSALDNTSQRRVQDLVRQRFRGRTVVEVAHRLDAIRDADRIVVLKAGAITEEGTFPDLLAARGLFHELWTSAGGSGEDSKTC